MKFTSYVAWRQAREEALTPDWDVQPILNVGRSALRPVPVVLFPSRMPSDGRYGRSARNRTALLGTMRSPRRNLDRS